MEDVTDFRKMVHEMDSFEDLQVLDQMIKDAAKILLLIEEADKLASELYGTKERMRFMMMLAPFEEDLDFLQAASQFTDGKVNYLQSKMNEEAEKSSEETAEGTEK